MEIIFVHECSFYKATDVEGDGNCLFRAITTDDLFAGKDHVLLRKEVIDKARNDIRDNKNSETTSLINKYFNSMQRNSRETQYCNT